MKNAVSRNMSGDRLQKFVDDFNQKLTGASRRPTEVTNAEVPIYAQNFSMEDLQGMIQFYESPLGQRVMKALPQVLQETQQGASRSSGQRLCATLKQMSGDYPEIKPLLPKTRSRRWRQVRAQPQSPKPSQLSSRSHDRAATTAAEVVEQGNSRTSGEARATPWRASGCVP